VSASAGFSKGILRYADRGARPTTVAGDGRDLIYVGHVDCDILYISERIGIRYRDPDLVIVVCICVQRILEVRGTVEPQYTGAGIDSEVCLVCTAGQAVDKAQSLAVIVVRGLYIGHCGCILRHADRGVCSTTVAGDGRGLVLIDTGVA